MRIGIDATNIGGGGGLTHLKEILENFDKIHFNDIISKIIIFSSQNVLDELPNSNFFEKKTFQALNSSLLNRVKFQLSGYDKEIEKRCDILFSITGDYIGNFKPIVAMSRNMLLYERDIWKEIKQPKEILRFWFNFKKQQRCFKNASGLIFISSYAQEYVGKSLSNFEKDKTIINHGISQRFLGKTKKQNPIKEYSFKKPFKFLYISTVHVYKHQWNVVKAISALRKKGYYAELTLVGGVIFNPSGRKLHKTISEEDPNNEFIHFKGNISYDTIEKYYDETDGIVFASTCENMPNILIESMASGVPIACSDKQPMPEFLEDGGFYFNAKSVISITETLEKLLLNPNRRGEMVKENLVRVQQYSWSKTSNQTFEYITKVYKNKTYV